MLEAYLMTAAGLKKPIRQVGEMLVIEHERMKLSHDDEAVHQRHAWEFGETTFVVMKIDSKATVRLEDPAQGESTALGPFTEIWLVDGMILSNLDAEHPLARFDYNTKMWIEPQSGRSWPRVVFESTQAAEG